MIKALFFDLDGVLTTDARGSLTSIQNLCEIEPGLRVDDVVHALRSDIKLQRIGKESLEAMLKRICEDFSVPFAPDMLMRVARKAPWNTQMLELAHELEKQLVIGIITDNPRDRIEILSQEPQLQGHFDPIIASGIEKAAKADNTTTIYERALARAGCTAEESLFIDNQERNLVTPKGMGMHVHFHDDAKNDVQALREALHTLNIDC